MCKKWKIREYEMVIEKKEYPHDATTIGMQH
jgi:hypothetical protein